MSCTELIKEPYNVLTRALQGMVPVTLGHGQQQMGLKQNISDLDQGGPVESNHRPPRKRPYESYYINGHQGLVSYMMYWAIITGLTEKVSICLWQEVKVN